MPGVATVLNIYPSEHLAVVVLTNASDWCNIGRIALDIAATVLPRYAETRRGRQPTSELDEHADRRSRASRTIDGYDAA